MVGGPPATPRHGVLPKLAVGAVAVLAAGLLAFVVAVNVTHVGIAGVQQVPKAAAPAASPEPLPDVGRALLSRVLTVEVERSNAESLGTAWLIDGNCDYVTNAHVIFGEQTLRITDRTAHTHMAVIVGQDPQADIAVLHCTDGFNAGAPLPVQKAAIKSVPLSVVVLASSRATGQGDMTLETIGLVHQDVPLSSGDIQPGSAAPTVYHDMLDMTGAKVYQGNSGGPVVNQQGQVVGILTLASPGGPEAFAIPISRVLTELYQWARKA